MAKVTGIGGVFFKSSSDQEALKSWYEKNLGFSFEEWGGAILRWGNDKATDNGLTVWHTADKESDWFAPSKSSFMINYRIDNMDEMMAQLKSNGVEFVKGPEQHPNGKFLWIMDPEGNKVELWEPKAWDHSEEEKSAETTASNSNHKN